MRPDNLEEICTEAAIDVEHTLALASLGLDCSVSLHNLIRHMLSYPPEHKLERGVSGAS